MATFPFEMYEKMVAEELASMPKPQTSDDFHALDDPDADSKDMQNAQNKEPEIVQDAQNTCSNESGDAHAD